MPFYYFKYYVSGKCNPVCSFWMFGMCIFDNIYVKTSEFITLQYFKASVGRFVVKYNYRNLK